MGHEILIIAAVSEELDGLGDRMEVLSQTRTDGKRIIRGRLAGQTVCLLETGPGLINTAQVLTAAIETERPALVIQTGCAGAFEESGLFWGDIGIASQEIDAQLGVETPGANTIVSPLPFPILKKEALRVRNTYPIDPDLVEMAHVALKETMPDDSVRIGVGPFVTVVTVTATDARAKQLHGEYGALMENMEGAAAAHVCIRYDIPFLEIRSVSNRVGRRDKDTWNLPLAFERASQAVYTVIERISL